MGKKNPNDFQTIKTYDGSHILDKNVHKIQTLDFLFIILLQDITELIDF